MLPLRVARLLLAALIIVAPAAAASVTKDIVYGEATGQKLLLDASTPDGAGPFPVAILVHGGGWRRGDKGPSPTPNDNADISPWFETLTTAKFTWFSINYRHAPAHRWPACYEDLLTAIRWVKTHAAAYQGDPARIALFGHSAGGHLVCLAATNTAPDTRVQAVLGFAAVTDFLPAPGATKTNNNMTNLFGFPAEVTPATLARLRDASPLHHAGPGLPPILLLHGEADPGVPIAQSLAFREKIRAAGGTCDLFAIPRAGHTLSNWDEVDPGYRERMLAWLRGKLSARTSAP